MREQVPPSSPSPLPKVTTRHSLEGASQRAGNPPAVKITRLRHHRFIIDAAPVEWTSIECDMITQHRKRRRGVRIAPANAGQNVVSCNHVPINCLALPFAEGASTGAAEDARRYVSGRNIITWRVTGFEGADARTCIGDDHTAVLDNDPRRTGFGDRRARIGPHAFLARSDRIRVGSHDFDLREARRCSRGRTRRNSR